MKAASISQRVQRGSGRGEEGSQRIVLWPSWNLFSLHSDATLLQLGKNPSHDAHSVNLCVNVCTCVFAA